MNKLLTTIACILLSACSTTDYKMYSDSVTEIELNKTKIEIAKHNAEAEKYKAMAVIAASGTETAKVAAVIAMTVGTGTNSQVQQNYQQLRAPESASETALRWGSILIPSLTQLYTVKAAADVSIRNSDNNAAIAQSTNNAFVGMAGKIQAPVVTPQANVTTTTNTTTDSYNNTLSGTGNLGSGSYATTDSRGYTLSGTGTLGTGAYNNTPTTTSTTTDNHAVSSTPVFATPVFSPVPVTPVP